MDSSGGYPHNSLRADLRAAERILVSKRFRALAISVGTAAWSTLVAVGGWIAAKVDNKAELVAMRLEVGTVASQQREVGRMITELTGPDGVITNIRQGQQAIGRVAVSAMAMSLALESEKRRAAMVAAAAPVLGAYDGAVARGKPPSEALEKALDRVAIP